MAELSKMLRQKRFKFKDETSQLLVIDTSLGLRLEMQLVNCSLNGLGAHWTNAPADFGGLETDQLVPASKITADGKELTIGRLVVRRVQAGPKHAYLAFSTIDTRIPVDGMLSKFLDLDLDDNINAFEFELSPDKFNVGTFAEGVDTNTDLFHRANQFDIFFQEWKKAPKYQYYNIRLASQGSRVNLQQKRKNGRHDYLVMGSNDYLGLASHPQVIEAAKSALDKYGFGSTGSPLSTGLTDVHEDLANQVAKMFRKEKAILFNSGYAANVGAITGLTRSQDFIIADTISHASIQDGMTMSRATSRFYKHNDLEHLEKMLQESRDAHSGSLVITEGVFSMDGDIPPLNDIMRLARKYNSRVFLDEAHSFGVLGPTGLGCWEKYANTEVDIIMGTFSKVCGGIGGFIATSSAVANWLSWHARAHIFSVTIPPSTAAATLTALKIFEATPQLVTDLRRNIRHFVTGLREIGCPIDLRHESSVIPVVIGDEVKLGKMNEVFREQGVYVIPVIYPAVGRKNCRFRFTIMATHSTSDLDYVLNVIEMAMIKADFRFPGSTTRLEGKNAA